ncbi:MAG: hypothetical protein Q8S58_15310 [Bosea sp. (in: a-proteobacteria)]|nr:hypothetical protein [Bosea sp. (in: a-proteobacteria)]
MADGLVRLEGRSLELGLARPGRKGNRAGAPSRMPANHGENIAWPEQIAALAGFLPSILVCA